MPAPPAVIALQPRQTFPIAGLSALKLSAAWRRSATYRFLKWTCRPNVPNESNILPNAIRLTRPDTTVRSKSAQKYTIGAGKCLHKQLLFIITII
jgi:hypothetical protein